MRKILIASDHAGFELKSKLAAVLTDWNYLVEDLGVDVPESVDYPDYALDLARRVGRGDAALGVLVCGTGVGMAIAANKVPGVRAATICDEYSARMARSHNDLNVLCLGGRVLGPDRATAILRAWLDSTFEGGRHQRRLDKISAAEPRG